MEDLLQDKKFNKQLEKIAFQTGVSVSDTQEEAEGYMKELYSEHQPMSNLVGIQAAQYVVSRGYDKTIDVNPAEIKKLTKLMRHNSVAFVMTHKTYIDMFVLALVLTRHGMPLPFTFAGINLNLLGLGQMAKSTGVIFIRRSIKENLVYKATLRHFIGDLVKRKQHFMWAIEGTRSRTGKLVWPKMGILKYIMDGAQDIQGDVKYVPVSIVYDLIPDVKEMTKEGRGKIKQAESLGWLVNYVKKMGGNYGRIALRFGDPVESTSVGDKLAIGHQVADTATVLRDKNEASSEEAGSAVFRHAFELVHRINQITPVTTAALICISLLSKFSLGKRAIESDVVHLMKLIEEQKPDALVDRGKAIGESVQEAIQLLRKAELIRQKGEGIKAKYIIASENYLPATYYANMSVHHLYHRAFIEMALLSIEGSPIKGRSLSFWEEIMQLRDLFKFEFFYSQKKYFSDEIEANLNFIDAKWKNRFRRKSLEIPKLLNDQKILVAPVVLFTYIEAYRVIAHGLLTWDLADAFDEKRFMEDCLFIGEEMQWQGKIQRLESVSKPFILNGIRLAKNAGLIPEIGDNKRDKINLFINRLDKLSDRIKILQGYTLSKPENEIHVVPIERDIVPGSKTDGITKEIMLEESGPHIGAFFDLDRTLIKGFSAKEFFQSRLLSGKITSKEILAQFAGVLVYATGNGNFAGLASISAKGIKGIKEDVFIQLGEEVYTKHLADTIFPESRALVSAHLAKGHTVAIISAATPYQVAPIARDIGIDEIMCTRMEVKNGKFTGAIVEPACWGEGKAHAARVLAEKYKLDLSKSYFYTDSIDDLALLEIVGRPMPLNPDTKLSALAFKNDWPVSRFTDESPNIITQFLRTGLAASATIPAAIAGLAVGSKNLSWNDGVNSMMANVGDLVTALAGIKLAVKGEEHLWSQRPAVFIFNHQSNADLFIAAKLVRKNVRGVAKKELQMTPILGQLMMAAGVIFVDRGNKDKAIEAMQPAVDSLKNGTSVLIFPEGTRSYDYNLGPFKKGAFHLAMQAGVPLVPVVVKNAHDVMPRGTNIFRPAQVDVIVLPPIPTKDWTKKNMNNKIINVRNLFLKELGQEIVG